MQISGYRVVLTTNENNLIFINGYSYLEDYSYEGVLVSTSVLTQRLYTQETLELIYNVPMTFEDFININSEGYILEGLYYDYTFTRKYSEEDFLEYLDEKYIQASFVNNKYVKWIEE